MPDLKSQMTAFRREQAEATTRNISHSRPATTAPTRISTPNPAAVASSASAAATPKRNHDDAFNVPGKVDKTASSSLLTQVTTCIDTLKAEGPMTIDRLIDKSLLVSSSDRENVKARVLTILRESARCRTIPPSANNKEEMLAFRPIHPVSNAEELKNYLARQKTAEGVAVKDLKEGWPQAVEVIDQLEREHSLLAVRNKKDNTPKRVWTDSPNLHTHISDDFKTFWNKTKLPASENEIQNELKQNGITATSQIKESKKMDMKKKDRKRPNRRGGKTTNAHMVGILKDYTRK